MKYHVTIGSDHRGFRLKSELILGCDFCEFHDIGCFNESPCDYPDVVADMSTKIQQFGVLICNTGIGMSVAANSYNNLSAALCMNQDMARTAREHNNANVLVLGAKYLNTIQAINLLQIFVSSKFDESAKNLQRLGKIGKKINTVY